MNEARGGRWTPSRMVAYAMCYTWPTWRARPWQPGCHAYAPLVRQSLCLVCCQRVIECRAKPADLVNRCHKLLLQIGDCAYSSGGPRP
ncbi:unnamed protein product [Protopolystoma xenopodis]|uniref:Uncharacterized protein n=1 Tax=Protopolystoma xenopodis TaxID=117903 RepID=A0A3S5CLZ7_9PLAT|nr:unnamed protein product [Protopolystoma xenopodis]